MSDRLPEPDDVLREVGSQWYSPDPADYQHLSDGLFSILRREVARVDTLIGPDKDEALFDITPQTIASRAIERVGICRCNKRRFGILHSVIKIVTPDVHDPTRELNATAVARNIAIARGYNGVEGRLEDVGAKLAIRDGNVELMWPAPKMTRMVVAENEHFRYYGQSKRHIPVPQPVTASAPNTLRLQMTVLESAHQVLVRCNPDTYLPNQEFVK